MAEEVKNNIPNAPGAYKILHEETGTVYYGSSKNLAKRQNYHKNDLENNRHSNKNLQEAYNTSPVIKFEVLAVTDDREAAYDIEQQHLLKNKDNPLLANIALDARVAQKGIQRSEEVRKKLSEANKGFVVTEETKKKISQTLTGKSVSDETRQKLSKAHTGKVLSEETRKKISQVNSGRKLSNETRQKMSLAKLGVPKTAEHNRNATLARAGFKQSPETIEKMREISSLPITIDGITYPSRKVAAEKLGVSKSTIFRKYV